MVDSCSRENGVLGTVARSWLLFLHDESECKNLNQILLEVLMNCTKQFYLSSSLTASCVARFMMCWVCSLNFSGLFCSVLSLDECLIKITNGRFVWLLGSFVASYDIVFDWYAMLRGVFIEKRFFFERWLTFSLINGLVAVKLKVNIVVWSGLSMLEVCCKVDFLSSLAVEGNCLNANVSMPGESALLESFMFGQGRIQIPSLACLFDSVI